MIEECWSLAEQRKRSVSFSGGRNVYVSGSSLVWEGSCVLFVVLGHESDDAIPVRRRVSSPSFRDELDLVRGSDVELSSSSVCDETDLAEAGNVEPRPPLGAE